MNYVNAKYAPANTQSQGNANDCDTGTNCAINSPQTQGDGSASSPTNLQISKFNEEQGEPPSTPPSGPFTAVVVYTHVICPTGKQCPSASDFEYRIAGPPTFSPDRFRGSETGQRIAVTGIVGDGFPFWVSQTAPPTPAGLILVVSPASICLDRVVQGLVTECFFVNEYRVAPTP
jgi:hypothetical protein